MCKLVNDPVCKMMIVTFVVSTVIWSLPSSFSRTVKEEVVNAYTNIDWQTNTTKYSTCFRKDRNSMAHDQTLRLTLG